MGIKYKSFLLIISLISSILIFSSCEKKRIPVSYELPKGYVGWVTVKYEKNNAPALQIADGKYHVKISDKGFAETSSPVEDGWAEDEYYWMDGGKKIILPQNSDSNTSMIHAEVFSYTGFQSFVNIDTLEIGKEITLLDGGKVTKLDNKGGVNFKSGRPLLFHFYVSGKMEDIWDFPNKHMPSLPKEREVW